MINKVCLITQMIYNPQRRPDESEQISDENNEGLIRMVEEAARSAMQSGDKVLILWDFYHREIDETKLDLHRVKTYGVKTLERVT